MQQETEGWCRIWIKHLFEQRLAEAFIYLLMIKGWETRFCNFWSLYFSYWQAVDIVYRVLTVCHNPNGYNLSATERLLGKGDSNGMCCGSLEYRAYCEVTLIGDTPLKSTGGQQSFPSFWSWVWDAVICLLLTDTPQQTPTTRQHHEPIHWPDFPLTHTAHTGLWASKTVDWKNTLSCQAPRSCVEN